jgi:hypothetical protein
MRESRWQARAGVLNRLSARLLPAGLTLAAAASIRFDANIEPRHGFDRVGRRA